VGDDGSFDRGAGSSLSAGGVGLGFVRVSGVGGDECALPDRAGLVADSLQQAAADESG
jgi:hypothetical protein